MSNGYQIINTCPTPEQYCRLRQATGLSEKTLAAAQIALPNTWFGAQIIYQQAVVGMGRIIGDGGCFFQIVDIAVLPEHQGKGLGKKIMTALIDHFDKHAPTSAYISLIADGAAKNLYAKFGFKPTAPESVGMYRMKK